jgi:hypothetical protein
LSNPNSWGILKKNYFLGLILMALFCVMVYFIYDVLFSPPTIHKGIIVEKIFVPGKYVAGPNIATGSRYRTYKYNITAKAQHQWVAFVKDETGELLKVNCKSNHYEGKEVGDTLLFKEFRGNVFKTEYFSHNDEDIDSLDLRKNHIH